MQWYYFYLSGAIQENNNKITAQYKTIDNDTFYKYYLMPALL